MTGKTHLLTGVCGGLPAKRRVRFVTGAPLVNELAEAKHQLQRRRVRRLRPYDSKTKAA